MRISEKGMEDTSDEWEQEEWYMCTKDTSCIERETVEVEL